MACVPVTAVEGGVCSGKTTLVGLLGSDGYVLCLPEYVEWLRASGRPLPTGSPEQRLEGYLRVDDERARIIGASRHPAILDRSILTLIAYEYAVKRLYFSTAWFGLRQALQSRQLLIPNRIILTDVDENERIQLWRDRGLELDAIFVNEDFNAHLREFFSAMSKVFPVLTLKVIGEEPKSVVANAMDFVRLTTSIPPPDVGAIFDVVPDN